MARTQHGERSKPVAQRNRSRASATSEQVQNSEFTIVAVGASAGGLEAMRGLLDAMPDETGLAFVMIQHLAPTHDSAMASLLVGHTTMKVHLAEDGMTVLPGNVYVNPPGVFVSLDHDTLHLTPPPDGTTVRMAIDHFLLSLANDHLDRAIGVILSGTGTDGSQGVRAIKQHGGLAIAQLPSEAAYDGMPQSAIATGVVDLVLSLKDMPTALFAWAGHARHTPASPDTQAPLLTAAIVSEIAEAVRLATGQDIAHYKPGMLTRRIQRRMNLTQIGEPNTYRDRVKNDPAEAQQLVRDLLISVTGFFRDADAYAALETDAIPPLLARLQGDGPIRAWVAGCSTGEEAYSVAMVLIEQIAAADRRNGIQVFATDIDEDALKIGRAGVYPASIAGAMSPRRLETYFVRDGDSYRVIKDLRESVVFARHDLAVDPAFSRLDLMVCRNVLIYLRPEVQQRILSAFRFALHDGGVLFLGAAESLGSAGSLFVRVARQAQIYRAVSRPRTMSLPRRIGTLPRNPATAPGSAPSFPRLQTDPDEIARNALLDAFAPPAVLINRRGEALFFQGRVEKYLTMVSGRASFDVARMARPGLADKLRIAIPRVAKRREKLVFSGVPFGRGRRQSLVTIDVRPVGGEDEGMCLVSFVDPPAIDPEQTGDVATAATSSATIAQLELELKAVNDELQSTIQDLETSNDELRAINEQTMSLNEEMQASNEELEASKEELQSLNEELTTLNAQLRDSLDRQGTISDDLHNVMSSSDVATLFLDTNMNIRFFTPAVQRLFNIQQGDVGRPIGDFTRTFTDQDLARQAMGVLRDLVPVRREVLAESGAWFNRRMLPYLTSDRKIDGVVITFSDITELKQAEQLASAAFAESENVINSVHQPLLILDDQAVVQSANRAFHRFFATTDTAIVGKKLGEIAGRAFQVPALNAAIDLLMAGGDPVEDFEVVLQSNTRETRTILVAARDLWKKSLDARRILVAIEDITAVRRYSRELRAAKEAAETSNAAKSGFLMAVSHDLRQPLQTMLLLQGVLSAETFDDATRDLIDGLGAALDEMDDTLDALLDINQLQTGAIHPVIEDFPIRHLFDRIRSEFREPARAKSLALRIVDSTAVVRTDPRLFERIVQNLVSNAFKYTSSGKVLIGCRRRGGVLRIEVRDTGIGIAPDKLQRIFEENYQVDAMSGQHRGRGLGLSIALRFAQLLDHKLDVASRLGQGSTFSVEVPLGKTGAKGAKRDAGGGVAPRSREYSASAAARSVAASDGALVRIVEDDAGVRAAMVLLLQGAGYTVEAFASAEALLAAPAARVGCILVDNGLPGRSGSN